MLRFECPRCQTVFTRDEGGDDAFVECPSCGAMAMSAGEATGVDSDALARTLSSTHDAPALQRGLEPTADGDAAADGDASREADRTAAASGDGDGDGGGDDVEDSSRSPRPAVSDEGEPGSGGGIFNNLLGGLADGDAPAPPAAPPAAKAASSNSSLDLGLDDELGDFDLPVAAAPKPRPAPKKTTPPRRTGEGPVSTPDVVAPPPASENVAVNLGEDAMGALEAAFDSLAAAPPVARRGSSLSDDERRFLENVMGSGPPPPPPQGSKSSKPPPRPSEKSGVPRGAPPPLKKRPPSSGFALTPEAREAAFIPLKVKRAPPKAPPPPPPRDDDPEITSPNDLAPRRSSRPAHSTDDMPELPAPAADGAINDAIAKMPTAAKAARAPRPKPSVWSGLHKGALAAAILVGVLVGAGGGAALAPPQQKRTDGRARAELALADGNRYYEVARYDDALGKFKNAINNDRTYAPAHRAKGAALAKQGQMAAQTQRGDEAQKLWDEAAAAYREYLALEPSAIDGADIKEALARRGVAPVATGSSDG